MELKFAVCDDNIEHLNTIRQTILKLSDRFDIQVFVYQSPEALWEGLGREGQKLPVDFVLLDIELPGIDGIKLGRQIKDTYPDICLVLITSYIEYAVAGYASRANHYLLKPITVEHIENLIVTYIQEQKKTKRIAVKDKDGEHMLSLKDIVYISSEDKYTVLHTEDQYYIDYRSLKDYENLLSDYGFFRIHRKYLINMYYNKNLKKGFVVLDGDIRLPISRRRERLYREHLLKFMEGKLL